MSEPNLFSKHSDLHLHNHTVAHTAHLNYSEMAEGEQPAEVAPVAEVQESSGSGFYNRRLHNYPLIKVWQPYTHMHTTVYTTAVGG